MRYAFPCDIVADSEEGREAYVVTFPDVYEATTGGWSWDEAVALAQDALVAALAMYVKVREAIPVPSRPIDGQVLILVPALVAAKLALYTAMRAQNISNVGLADRLGLTENAVRRLVDPDHRSHIGQVEKVLQAVGRTITVEDNALNTIPTTDAVSTFVEAEWGNLMGGDKNQQRQVTYSGQRSIGRCTIFRDSVALPLYRAEDHAPKNALGTSGPEWGYGGRGPAKTAFALILDHTGDSRATARHYLAFRDHVVAAWKADTWQITSAEINRWLATRV